VSETAKKRCDLTELLVRDCAHCRDGKNKSRPMSQKLTEKVSGPESPFRTGLPSPQPRHSSYADHEYEPKGPWFTASFDSGRCSGCGDEILVGDTIRADGQGGWEGWCCQDEVG